MVFFRDTHDGRSERGTTRIQATCMVLSASIICHETLLSTCWETRCLTTQVYKRTAKNSLESRNKMETKKFANGSRFRKCYTCRNTPGSEKELIQVHFGVYFLTPLTYSTYYFHHFYIQYKYSYKQALKSKRWGVYKKSRNAWSNRPPSAVIT